MQTKLLKTGKDILVIIENITHSENTTSIEKNIRSNS